MHHGGHHHGEPGVYYVARRPKLSWGDVGGYPEIKETLKEMVSLPLARPELIAELRIEPPAGVLMWGPLGAGMKMLAEAAAMEADADWVFVSGQEMLGKPEEIRKAFATALEMAPCVLFISDVEWLAPRAGADYQWAEGNRRGIPPTFADKELTTVLLEEIDKLQGGDGTAAAKKGVALVGSCYRIDVVDQAVVKEKSRFNRKLFVHPPTVDDREDTLRIYTGRLGDNVADDVDIRRIAEVTEGFTGFDIDNLCKRAALDAAKDGTTTVDMKHFLQAVGEVEPWLTPDMTQKYYELREMDCSHFYTF